MATAFDVAVRQQAYIEGVKNYEQDAIEPTAEALAALLALLLVKWKYPTIGAMPKKVLREFTAEFNSRAARILDKLTASYWAELRQVARADLLVTSVNLAYLTNKPAVSPKTADVWAKMTNEPLAASGHLPGALLRDFARSTITQIGLLIKQGYANKWTPAQLLEALNGTRARKYKDGLLNKVSNQFHTVSNTLIQHVHQWLNYNLGRLFYDNYQWVSVLDSQTTEICRSRNGNIYRYGEGPRPPAHYNCRSTIVGIAGVTAYPSPTFYNWVSAQPLALQNDLLGTRRGQDLRAGRTGANQFPRFDGTRKLTPKEFGQRQPHMIED